MSEADGEKADQEIRATHTLTRWVTRLLYAQIFIGAMSVASGFFEFHLLQDFASGLYYSRAQVVAAAQANDLRQGFISTSSAIIFVVAGILILRWIFLVGRNAARLAGTQMHYSPTAAVGWYFIPVANLWKPYQAMKEIWTTSASCGGRRESLKPPFYLNAWWSLWLMSGVLGYFALRLGMQAKDLEDLQLTSAISIASDVVLIPLSMVFMVIVREIVHLQERCRVGDGATE